MLSNLWRDTKYWVYHHIQSCHSWPEIISVLTQYPPCCSLPTSAAVTANKSRKTIFRFSISFRGVCQTLRGGGMLVCWDDLNCPRLFSQLNAWPGLAILYCSVLFCLPYTHSRLPRLTDLCWCLSSTIINNPSQVLLRYQLSSSWY